MILINTSFLKMSSYNFVVPKNHARQHVRVLNVECLLRKINEFYLVENPDDALKLWKTIKRFSPVCFGEKLINELMENSDDEYDFTEELKKLIYKELRNLIE